MELDDLTGEPFARVVGRRSRAPLGAAPDAEHRAALAKLSRYRTRAPKGVFVYKSHAEANADQERWVVDAVVARQNG